MSSGWGTVDSRVGSRVEGRPENGHGDSQGGRTGTHRAASPKYNFAPVLGCLRFFLFYPLEQIPEYISILRSCEGVFRNRVQSNQLFSGIGSRTNVPNWPNRLNVRGSRGCIISKMAKVLHHTYFDIAPVKIGAAEDMLKVNKKTGAKIAHKRIKEARKDTNDALRRAKKREVEAAYHEYEVSQKLRSNEDHMNSQTSTRGRDIIYLSKHNMKHCSLFLIQQIRA